MSLFPFGKPIVETLKNFRRDVIGRYKPGIWIITIEALLAAAGFAITIPFLSLYLFQDRGLSMIMVGTIMLIAGLFSAAAHMVGGELSDRFGRRPILIGSLSIRMVMYLVMAVLVGMSAPVWLIVVAYIIAQSVGVMARPVASAIVTDLSPKKRLTETFGLLRVGINLGWAAGPAIGGYLATFLPYSWLFGVAALFTTLAFILVAFFLRETYTKSHEKQDLQSLLSIKKDRTFLLFTGVSLLVLLMYGQMISTLSIFAVDRMGLSTAQYGLLLTVNGLIVVLFQYPIARKLGNFIKSRVLIVGSLLYMLGYLTFGWAGGFVGAVVAIVIITLGEIIHAPTSLAVVGELAPSKYRGRYMGFFGLSQILGIAFGPLLGGILLDVFPTNSLLIWGVIASLGFAAAIGFYWWGKVMVQIKH
ncbi:MFS transporter [Candidatus Pacearchaeota archaeon]|nr:MFS transporter [Candidatus Pacearchaeota archaeon]